MHNVSIRSQKLREEIDDHKSVAKYEKKRKANVHMLRRESLEADSERPPCPL